MANSKTAKKLSSAQAKAASSSMWPAQSGIVDFFEIRAAPAAPKTIPKGGHRNSSPLIPLVCAGLCCDDINYDVCTA